MKQKTITFILLFTASILHAQNPPKVLFIGNSYTEVNNLPQMIYDIAENMGDRMTFGSNTPGGCTFMQHCNNQSMSMIQEGGWDFVVLQEQSQLPSFPQNQVENEVFPYAQRLVDSIYLHNPCAEPMFYMTWGRKNGDPQNAQYFPVLGSYEGMDSMLCERYTYMAEVNDASLCPVGRVWRHLRTHYRDIELYASDGSHPSTAGTYAAACAFYVMFFHRDPDSISFNGTLEEATAQIIRNTVKSIVFDSLSHWQRPLPTATLTADIDSTTVFFTNNSLHADRMTCDFGDGTSHILEDGEVAFSHTYADSGIYHVTFVASRHCMDDTLQQDIHIQFAHNNVNITQTEIPLQIYPNPTSSLLVVDAPSIQQITLKDLSGHLLMTYTTRQIDLGHLPAGIYLIEVKAASGTSTQTVIKQP